MSILEIREVSLFVKVIGQGYPVLLMHGGPGLDHSTLLSFLPLADQFTLVFYDHRCNGRSEGGDVSSMTFENLIADADALRQKLGFDKWAVLGHSFGGMVALEYALRYPQSLSHLLLLDTCGDTSWVQRNAPEILIKRGYSDSAVNAARRFFNGQIASDQVYAALLKFAKAYFYHFSFLNQLRDVVSGSHPVMRPDVLIFGFSQLLTGWSIMNRLNEIKTPTLVLAGRYDFQFPPEHQAILADRLPDARLELIECAGHNAHVEQSAEVIRIVRRFLSAGDTYERNEYI